MNKIKLILMVTTFFLTLEVRANEVVKWSNLALQAIRINKTVPPVAARNLAVLQVGIYDVVNSYSKKNQPYLKYFELDKEINLEIAVARVSFDLLSEMYPTWKPTWEENLNSTLIKFKNDHIKLNSFDYADKVAQMIWDLRKDDLKVSSNFDYHYFLNDVGVWVPTPPKYDPPLLANWGKVKPFGILEGKQFRQDGPPKFYSLEYAKDFNEIKEYGSKTNSKRTKEQTDIALFWADGSGTVTPPGHWNKIAINIIKAKNLDIFETSKLMTLLNISLADAGISAWDMKYTFNCWRPITAVRDAGIDDNVQTESDEGWEPLLITPPFPDYVSGHSTFSAAASTILSLYFGTDRFNFSTDSEGLPGVIRNYSSFSEAAYEAGRSRIYGGIHYEFANRDGLRAGRKVAEYIYSKILTKN